MRRSEFVTVPSFSPQPSAGSKTCANAFVSVRSMMSELTTSSHRASARFACSPSGRLTTGFVPMIQTALMRPASTALKRSTAFSPGRDVIEFEMSVQHVREAADFASTHRVRLSGERERPHAGLADASRHEMAVDDAVDLVGTRARLVDALRIHRHDTLGAREETIELEQLMRIDLAGPGRLREIGAIGCGERGIEARRVRIDERGVGRIVFREEREQAVEELHVGT